MAERGEIGAGARYLQNAFPVWIESVPSFGVVRYDASEKMTQVQALERVTSTLYGEEMLFDGHTYTKDW